MKEELIEEPQLVEGFVTCRKCAYDENRICDELCTSLENVVISSIFGAVTYRGLYCFRGQFKIKSLFV